MQSRKYQPEIVAFDYESTGLDYWSPDFRVLSCAFAWRGKEGEMRTKYTEGEYETFKFLKRISEHDIPLLCHNLSFEHGVTSNRYSSLASELGIHVDTMRMLQVADNGGAEDYTGEMSLEDELASLEGYKRKKTGLSLESGIRRHLPDELHNHKEPFYRWLRENGVKKGQEGANLEKLPKDLFIDYNVLDSVRTLQLYEALKAQFEEEQYDWTFDHKLYVFMAKQISDARGRGVPVDLERARARVQEIQNEVAEIDKAFRLEFLPHIRKIEQAKIDAWCQAPKTDRGRANRVAKVESGVVSFEFNVNSTHQLRALFCDELGMEAKFTTAKGNPSFAAAFAKQWGKGGELLGNRKSQLLTLKQTQNLIALSENDGRWAIDLKACGTKTGRMAGGQQ